MTRVLLVWLAIWGSAAGAELRFAIHADPKTLDPHVVMDEPSEIVQYLTAGTLVRLNRLTQKLEPALASGWRILDGGRAIEFRLRPRLTFSDGTPFSAADVAFSIRRISNPALHSPYAELLKMGAGNVTTEVCSSSLVIVHVPAPIANLPELFDQIAIIPAKPAGKTAVLGPFEIVDYKSGSYLLLRRNPHYWRKDSAGRPLPSLDSIRLEILSNRDLELLRFRRGELHVINGLDAESFDRLQAEAPGSVQDLGPSLDSEQFWFNQVANAPLAAYKRDWFRSTAFRQAVSAAINREDICRLVYRGHARPAAGSVSPANKLWVNAKLKPALFSPPAALELLSKAGFHQQGGLLFDAGGHKVEFAVITNAGNKARERIAALIQQDLAKIGITLNIVPLDFPSLIERITRTFQYEACLLGQMVELDPNEVLNVWRSSAPNHQWNPNQPRAETAWEAEIDRLMDEQAAALDPKKRKAAFDRVQQIAAEQQPFLYLVHKSALVGISPALKNAQPAVFRPQTLWNVDTLAISAPSGR